MSNPVAAFNDSDVGVFVAAVLHTVGALGFLGGVAGYIAWQRHLLRGHRHDNVLHASQFIAYASIVVNLLGGFMRTFEAGHPGLDAFGQSPWVRAIAVKHVFLFAAMAATIYLFERAAPRLLAQQRAGQVPQPTGPAKAAVFLAILGVVVAAFLGALSQSVPIVSGEPDDEQSVPLPPVYANATGQLTSTTLAPATAGGAFAVFANATHLHAKLTWTPGQFALRLAVVAPDGQRFEGDAAQSIAIESPQEGTWRYEVTSDLALQASWSLAVEIDRAPGHVHDV